MSEVSVGNHSLDDACEIAVATFGQYNTLPVAGTQVSFYDILMVGILIEMLFGGFFCCLLERKEVCLKFCVGGE